MSAPPVPTELANAEPLDNGELTLNLPLVHSILVGFLRNETSRVGFNRVVLGLSGGVDSALVAALAVEALGPQNVTGVSMPYRLSNAASLADATAVAEKLGMRQEVFDITPQVDAFFDRVPGASDARRGNKMARERMTILYDISARDNSLVLGTSNKTELLLGYGTIFGDIRPRSTRLATSTSPRSGSWRCTSTCLQRWSANLPQPTSGRASRTSRSWASRTRRSIGCCTTPSTAG